jgi:hypothetical protein
MKLRYKFLLSAAGMAAALFFIGRIAWTDAPRSAGALTVPILVALSPGSVAAGSPGFSLTIDGANFSKNSVARWSGEALTTTVVDDSTLRAQIPASDVSAHGSADVTVVNPSLPGEHPRVSNIMVFRIMPRADSY